MERTSLKCFVIPLLSFLILFIVLAEHNYFWLPPVLLSPLVQTKTGLLRGKLVEEVYEFMGIPFAEPPTGERRFRKPTPKKPWTGVFHATGPTKQCIQFVRGVKGSQQSEDCLTLNIYVPRKMLDTISTTARPLLPVYVFIHCGGFLLGNAKDWKGSMLSSFNNIIVIVMQYRLGPLGFAYFGEKAAANVGLWDQLEALKWICENIDAFGGDNKQITLGGESAGASSVSFHLLSPYSRSYFQRAIMESGSAISPWALKQPSEAFEFTKKFFSAVTALLDCGSVNDRSSVEEKLECLRSAPVGTLVRSYGNQPLGTIAPVVDGDFVPHNPANMLTSGDFYRVPLLIGFNREEGFGFLPPDSAKFVELLHSSSRSPTTDDYNSLVYKGYRSLFSVQRLAVLKQHYKPDQLSRSSIANAVIQIAGDLLFTCPTYVVANYTASFHVPVYAYVFTQRQSEFARAIHATELRYIFDNPLLTPSEKLLSQTILQYWGKTHLNVINNESTLAVFPSSVIGNFITSGKPSQNSWPAFVGSNCSNQIVELNLETQVYTSRESVTCNFKAEDCSFWHDNFMF